MIKAIVAIDEKRGLANDHGLPWHGKIPTDVHYYRTKINDGGILLMGYGLYKELSKPYPGGVNYVATSSDEPLADGFEAVKDAREFLKNAARDVWNLGGAALYASTFDLIDELYITQLRGDFHCTKFIPDYKQDFSLSSEGSPITENGITFTFQVWQRK